MDKISLKAKRHKLADNQKGFSNTYLTGKDEGEWYSTV